MKRAFWLIGFLLGLQQAFGGSDSSSAAQVNNDTLRLKMISGGEQRRLATINEETFLAGETHMLNIDGKRMSVQCVEIREQSALIKIGNESKPRELRLGEPHRQAAQNTIAKTSPKPNEHDLEFPDQDFAITLPSGWQKLTDIPPQFQNRLQGGAYGNANKTKYLVLVIADDHRFDGRLDEKATMEIEEIIASASIQTTRIGGQFIEVAGVRGYERRASLTADGVTLSEVGQIILAHGKIYIVQVACENGNADTDPELRECLSSFRFLSDDVPTKPRPLKNRPGIKTAGLVLLVAIVLLAVHVIRKSVSR